MKENKPGYKHTPLGWIPVNWELLELRDFVRTYSGGTPSRTQPNYYGGDIPWIKSGELNQGYIVQVEESITELGLKNSSAKIVDKNCLVIALYGATAGIPAITGLKAAINQAILAVIPNPNVADIYYLYLWFSTNRDNIIRTFCQGGQPNLSSEIVNSLLLPLPPLPEQKAIAKLLSTWDRAIDNVKLLIDNLELRKKWLMQQLLTGKKRLPGFSGEWKRVSAGEVFKSISIKANGNEELLSATQDMGIIPRSMLPARVTMPTGDTEAFKLVEEGDFVISLRSFQGGLEYSYYRGIVSPAYTVLKPKYEISDEFYKYYYKSYDFIGHLATAVIGIRDGKQISYDDFCLVKIPHPKMEEQIAIANVLQKTDKEIVLQKEKLETLKEQKKGLMQVLLTGKKRMKWD